MSSAAPEAGEGTLRVLGASQEDPTLETLSRTLAARGDLFFPSRDASQALRLALGENTEVAFVDVMLDGGAGLALVHHLTAARPEMAVFALAPESNLELGAQAVALGAAGFVSTPPSGDALLHAVGEVRARRAAEREKARLEAALNSAKRRSSLMDRLVQLAHGGTHPEVARAILDGLAELADAKGAALYAPVEPPRTECLRLHATGRGQDLPASSPAEDLIRLASARSAILVPLTVSERTVATAILEGIDPALEGDVTAFASFAATVLAFVDAGDARDREVTREGRARVYSFGYLQDIAGREIDKAKRHGRRLAVAAIVLDGDLASKSRPDVEQIVLGVVRDTDVLARFDEHEFYLLLPETDALGAHACRRRLLVRAEGDRRSRSLAGDRRGPVSSRPGRGAPLSIGIAGYPHDGTTIERLLRAAKQRAHDAVHSAVHSLGLAPLGLGEIIDVLLARPLAGASFGAPYPLDLVAPAMLSLIGSACREAKRGGAASVLVTARGGMGMASAARQVFEGRDPSVILADVRSAPRCENAEAIVVNAEHGAWVCCGRREEDRFRGVHAADPLLADLVAQRLSQVSGVRWT